MPISRNRSAPETSALAVPVVAAVPAPAPSRPDPGGFQAGKTSPPAISSHAGKPCTGLAECPERPRLVRRLFAAAEREIAAVEASLGGPSATAARRLGALAATLDRLATLDRKALARDASPGDADAPPVAAPVDADAWAEAVAAQLDPGKAGTVRKPRAG